jgi:hypothetical protein
VGGATGGGGKPGNAVASKHLPGTWFAALPDGSVIRGVNHVDSLVAHALRLQAAIDELRDVAEEDGIVQAVLGRWGV